MSKIYIVGAKRTPIGSFMGSLKDVSAVELGTTAIKAALQQGNVEPQQVDEVIMGNVLSAGLKQGPGRQALIHAGIPEEKVGYSINMLCGSGLKTVILGYQSIKAQMNDIVVSGGMESMSRAPYVVDSSIRTGVKMGNQSMFDTILSDGLMDAFNDNMHMGNTAENIATKHNITREQQDQFALDSQNKALKALSENAFDEEIAEVIIKGRKGDTVVNKDEYPRETSLDKLGNLRAAFQKEGSVTAGNASGINDGGSAVVLVSEEKLNELNLSPLVEIVGVGQGGVSPEVMGLGPVPAIEKALKHANLNLEDMDVIELNEAFAAQSLGVIRELSEAHHIDEETLLSKTNLRGGAIALGHPIGASGNRILVTLIYLMKQQNAKYGLASLCIGGGMGTAVILKNVEAQ